MGNTVAPATGASQKRLEHHYDRRSLTYASTFDNRFQSNFIRAMEMMTGKLSIFRMIRKFERSGAPTGLDFWGGALSAMGISVQTPQEQIDNIPSEGPVVIVANHTHGLVDGMVLAELMSRRRSDFQILTRSVLTGLDEVASSFLIPVPFPHAADAQEKSVEMRARAMERLKSGGAICVFPSGVVATSETAFGDPVEAEWNVFTAQLIRRSGAKVVPIRFKGGNSRWYHVANRVSATLRQGLLIHEIVHACNKPQSPVIGEVIDDERMAQLKKDPRGFIKWLREHTISLGD
ncbi:MAG: lysophospholipid acyltransferase family protein [Maritimibacter sp.]